MEECPICYIETSDNAFQILECAHSLCKLCFSKLRSRVCPFCRTPIGTKKRKKKQQRRYRPEPQAFISERERRNVSIIENITVEEIIPPLNRTRHRRRRNRTERPFITVPINLTDREIDFIESSDSSLDNRPIPIIRNSSVSDKKKQLYRKKRNRWREDQIRKRGGGKN